MKTLIGVGMGPGDPELVTMKAVRMLREADVVVVPVLGGLTEAGRAESIVRAYVDGERVKRLEFALDDRGGVTARRTSAWHEAAAIVAAEFAGGADTVAFGTLGDPNLYSTFSYLAQTVRGLVPGVRIETVAGITAMQDLASRAGISLAEGTEPVTLVPLNAGPEAVDQALAHGGAVIGYKLGAKASPPPSALRDRLAAADRLDGAIVGARLGLPGETITPLSALTPANSAVMDSGSVKDFPHYSPGNPPQGGNPPHKTNPDIPYLSTLIVPAKRRAATGSSLAGGDRDRVVVATTRIEPHGCDNHAVGGAGPELETGGERRGGQSAGERRGSVTFVGAGPGAAELLTFRGAAAIAAADVVIWASSLVHPDVLRHARVDAEVVDSATLPMEGVLPYYERAARDGLRVARVHSGDPSLWGAIQEQLDRCEQLGLSTDIVPGVSSFTAVAARIGRELTIPEVAQSVILTRLGGGKTPMPSGEQVAEFARHGTTMALFLSAARSGQLQDELLAGGYSPQTPCVVAFQVTWPDELIVHCVLADLAATIREHKLWKHTLVLVGPGLASGGSRSHLYHPGHFHGFRRADRQARKELRATKGSGT